MVDYLRINRRLEEIYSRNIFFVVGVPKSGTTWLQSLLDAHVEITCSGEENFSKLLSNFEHVVNDYNKAMAANNQKLGANGHMLFTQENLEHLIVTATGQLFDNYNGGSDIKCIGSKSPVMIETVRAYAHMIPGAKFIHIIRDGRDVCVSAWIRNLLWNEEGTRKRWPSFEIFVESTGLNWAGYINKARSVKIDFPDRYQEIHYERLHSDPESTIKGILEFLGVDASKPMIDLCIETASFEKLSRGRKRGQEDNESFYRKGIIGDWKNHFDQNCIEAFMKHGGSMLRELGYL